MAKKSRIIYNADGIVRTEAQMRRSYNSYLKYMQEWKNKGYATNETMDIKQYTKWHILQSLKGGDPNIARTIARENLSYNATAARGISKLAQEIKAPSKKGRRKKTDIFDIKSTLKTVAKAENAERQDEYDVIRNKYSNWRDIIKVEDREQVFLDLAAANIDLDMWELPDSVRDSLYHDELKRFRERFEADLYGEK